MTRAGLMRTLLPSRLLRFRNAKPLAAAACASPATCISNCRCFAQVKDVDKLNRDVWFTSGAPRAFPELPGDCRPPDKRTLQLGKTVRILHERLPTLLQSPLPSDILSPQITLHLFPSTHPHLPAVSGRLAYVAALWTAPVAWGRVPLFGNVKLTILSERVVRNGGSSVPFGSSDEKLIVKWKTCGKRGSNDNTGGVYRDKNIGTSDPTARILGFINGTGKASADTEPSEFCGLFIFEFDEEGRIIKHTIEHTEQGGHWDNMSRVVSVTDWLLGKFNGRKREEIPALAYCHERERLTQRRQ